MGVNMFIMSNLEKMQKKSILMSTIIITVMMIPYGTGQN